MQATIFSTSSQWGEIISEVETDTTFFHQIFFRFVFNFEMNSSQISRENINMNDPSETISSHDAFILEYSISIGYFRFLMIQN